jgi:hypothetical protein
MAIVTELRVLRLAHLFLDLGDQSYRNTCPAP